MIVVIDDLRHQPCGEARRLALSLCAGPSYPLSGMTYDGQGASDVEVSMLVLTAVSPQGPGPLVMIDLTRRISEAYLGPERERGVTRCSYPPA